MDYRKTCLQRLNCKNVWRGIKKIMGGIIRPGGPPANLPGDYEDLRDNRLLHNPNITSYPKDQREWNTFIQELNKWIKNETGSFDIGGSATAQFGGFSSDPASANIWWARYGQMVHMEFYFTTGTLNATSWDISPIPDNLVPRDDVTVSCAGMVQNGTPVDEGMCTINNSAKRLSFRLTAQFGVWTSGATAGFNTSGRHSIIYMLRQPGKH